MIPVGYYRPDLAETNASVSANVVNCVLIKDETGVAYGPNKGIAIQASATVIPEPPKGGVSVVNRAGNYFAYVGTQTTIQRFNTDATWTQVGSGFNLTSGDRWSMIPFGNFLLATNTTDGLKQYDVESGGAVASVANSYTPRIIFTAFNCVFGGDTLDTTGNRDNRLLRNSSINDYSVWTPGVNGAGAQPIPDGEEIVGGIELSDGFAVLLQRNAIRALNRTADSTVYTMSTIVMGTGAVNPYCYVGINGTCYFVDTEGFKAVSSSGLRVIGSEKVNRTFLANLGASGFDTIEASLDPAYERIIWRYQSATNSSDTVFGNAIAYYYSLDEFVPLRIDTMAILSLATPSYDMDSMATSWPSMDDPTMPDMDSRYWAGGEPRLFGIDANGKGGYFEGANLEATLDTMTQAFPYAVLATELKVVTDASSAMVSLAGRDALSSAKVYGAESAMQVSGVTKTRARGKNMTARIRIPAATQWTYIRGVDDIVVKRVGNR